MISDKRVVHIHFHWIHTISNYKIEFWLFSSRLIIFTLAFGILIISAPMNSMKIPAQIPTGIVYYWIGTIFPRCAIHVLYFNLPNGFTFNSTHNTPVMLAPLTISYYLDNKNHYDYLPNHKFYNSLFRFMKAECYFCILYYKLFNNSDIAASDDFFVHRLVSYF